MATSASAPNSSGSVVQWIFDTRPWWPDVVKTKDLVTHVSTSPRRPLPLPVIIITVIAAIPPRAAPSPPCRRIEQVVAAQSHEHLTRSGRRARLVLLAYSGL